MPPLANESIDWTRSDETYFSNPQMQFASETTTPIISFYIFALPLVVLVLVAMWRYYMRCFQDAPEADANEKQFIKSTSVAPILFDLPTGFKFSKYSTGQDEDDVLSDIWQSSNGSLISLPINCNCKWFKKRRVKRRRIEQPMAIETTSSSAEAATDDSGGIDVHDGENVVRDRVRHFFPIRWTTFKQSMTPVISVATPGATSRRESMVGSPKQELSPTQSRFECNVSFPKDLWRPDSKASSVHIHPILENVTGQKTLFEEDEENDESAPITFVDDKSDDGKRSLMRKSTTRFHVGAYSDTDIDI